MSNNILVDASRFLLFGPKLSDEFTLRSITQRKVVDLVRGAMGMPPSKGPGYWEWLKERFKRLWLWIWQMPEDRNGLPADLSEKMFAVIDSAMRDMGGRDKEGTPYFWAVRRDCISSPFFWSVAINYNPHVNSTDVNGKFESELEERLSRAGYDYNVRVQRKPLRIEIDKPKPPTITLRELWGWVAALPRNERNALLGQCWKKGETVTLAMEMVGEDFSGFIAGAPGSGKSQLAMAMLLSLAYTNSPDSLSMIIIDPKAIDFRPFAGLPHLSAAIVTEPLKAVEIVSDLVAEMDARTKQAARGDVSFLKNSIMLYVDEMSDLLNSLPGEQAQQLALHLQRLAQKGRGVGFVVIGATQRVYDVPASAHSKLNARIVGKMRNANDSVAASGVPGTTTNKLPGRGSFEIFCSEYQGLRIQAPFVADSQKPDYDKRIGEFIADIRARWGDARPGWGIAQPVPALQKSALIEIDEQPEVAQETAPSQAIPGGVDPDFYDQILSAAAADPGKFGQRTIRRMFMERYGKEMSGNTARRIYEAIFQSTANTIVAETA